VCFASPYPGKILPIDLSQLAENSSVRKMLFLCAAKGVSVGIEFSKIRSRTLVAEGFYHAKLEGGMAFVHSGGTLKLASGEILVDTGCIVGLRKISIMISNLLAE
jgi:uncharacterized protein (AIM24 family)